MTADSSYPPGGSSTAYQPLDNDLESASTSERDYAWRRTTSKRIHWRTAAGGVAAGFLLGAVAFHTTSRLRRPDEALRLLDSSSSQLSTDTSDILSVPVRIHYHNDPPLNQRDPIIPPDCPLPVVYTGEEQYADIIVYNTDRSQSPTADEQADRREHKPWQKTAVWGVESAPNRRSLEEHFQKLQEGKVNETADFTMTYRLNSTVPALYSYDYLNYDNPPVPLERKRSDKIAAAFISNCHPKNSRTLILDELMKLLPGKIDSFGACRNNANINDVLRELDAYEDAGDHSRWNEKITMISHYRFTVAFENSNDIDYATEKYFQALERGSVPLVFGPPDYAARFFPSPTAGIDLAEYLPSNYTELSTSSSSPPDELTDEAKAGLARLAKRLEHLMSDEGKGEYEKMLAWKRSWRDDPNNPLAKIVGLSTSKWSQDCRLAGVYRGQAWAQNTWRAP
ncbi:hypothetical protein JCM10207_000933 [Rhodosporidiobolus poonsookiae]